MKTLVIIAEVLLQEDEAEQILKTGKLGWDIRTPIAQICGKDIKFKSAAIVDRQELA